MYITDSRYLIMLVKQRNKFVKQSSGNYYKYVEINDILYKIIVNEENWNKYSLKINDAIKHWKKMILKGKNDYIFKYGKITEIDKTDDMDEIVKCLVCDICGKKYKHKSSYDYHRGVCNKKHKEDNKSTNNEGTNEKTIEETIDAQPINERIYNDNRTINNDNRTINNDNRTINNDNRTINININIPPLRNFGNENVKWVDRELIREILTNKITQDTIKHLIEKAYFNPKFPENQVIKFNDRCNIPGLAQIFRDGFWKIEPLRKVSGEIVGNVTIHIDEYIKPRDDSDLETDEHSLETEKHLYPLALEFKKSHGNIMNDKDKINEWVTVVTETENKDNKEDLVDYINLEMINKQYREEQLRERRIMS